MANYTTQISSIFQADNLRLLAFQSFLIYLFTVWIGIYGIEYLKCEEKNTYTKTTEYNSN